ncbi:MAG: hypothetical protein K0S55_977, partial [Clostridia bacterium]|nr:hypothetical protein [Clostridia bacterium]
MTDSFSLFITIAIPTIAVVCYIFLLAILLNTKKDRLIIIFSIYTSCTLLWALFSTFMRLQPQDATMWNNIMLNFIIIGMTLVYFWLTEYLSLKQPVISCILIILTAILLYVNFRGDMLKNVSCDENGFITYEIKYGVVAFSIYATLVLAISAFNIFFSLKTKKVSIKPIIFPGISIFLLTLGTIANLLPSIGKYPLD